MWVYDLETLRFLAVNKAAVRLYGYSEEEFLRMSITDIRPVEEVGFLLQELEGIKNDTSFKPQGIWRHRLRNGETIYAEITAANQLFSGRKARLILIQNITDRILTQKLSDLQTDLLEKIARDVPADHIFNELCMGIQQLRDDIYCAIMRLDNAHEWLHLVAAPSLPHAIKYQIGNCPADSQVIPCSRAVQTGQMQIVDNLAEGPDFQQFSELLKSTGIRSCWSMPVQSGKGDGVASFAFYSVHLPAPGPFELNCGHIGSNLISIVLERDANKRQLTQFFYDTLETRRIAEEERLRNIERLQHSEKRFRTLAENSPDLIYVEKLPERQIIYVNRKKVFGYTVREFVTMANNRNWLVHKEDIGRLRLLRQKLAQKDASEQQQQIELRVYNSQKQTEWISVRTSVMSRYPDGTIEQLLLTVTLITEQKKIAQSLEEGRANLEALIENTSDGIWAINRNFELTIINSSFRKTYKRVFGYELSIGDNILKKAPEDLADPWKLFYGKVLQGERFRRELHFMINDEAVYYEVSFNPITGKNGTIEGASVFSRNITAKKIAENELVKANFELDSFVYRASHDLRAPLRSVLGLIGLTRAEEDPDQRHYYLSLVEKSINRLDRFINDLTHFSRNSRMAVQSVAIDFDAIIDECADNLRYMEHADRVALNRDIRQEHPFYSDPARISIVFQNLLSNAVKYQRMNNPDAYISVHIRTADKKSIIVVSDNGIGIQTEHLPRIFDMFFRASAESYGSGLGLYITKQVVEKLRGTIHVESHPGEGTTFTIVLPDILPEKTAS